MTTVFETVICREDGALDIRARLMAKDATGAATKAGQGYAIKQSDLSALSYCVKDITDPDNPTTVVNSTPLTIASVISDSLVTTEALWKTDQYGYNLAHIVPGTAFPTGGNRYAVEYSFTTTGGYSNGFSVNCYAEKVYGS